MFIRSLRRWRRTRCYLGTSNLGKYLGRSDLRYARMCPWKRWHRRSYLSSRSVSHPNYPTRPLSHLTDFAGQNRRISIYVYSPNSGFDKLLSKKLTCPTCGTLGCSGAPKLGNECSNNPSVTKNASPAEDPENPSSLPGSSNTISLTSTQVCGTECSFQGDCQCGDYLCLEDVARSRQSKRLVSGCVFVLGSSSTWGRVGNDVPRVKREVESRNVALEYRTPRMEMGSDLSTCVCNATFTGEACCHAPGGMIYLD